MRYHLISIRMPTIKNKTQIKKNRKQQVLARMWENWDHVQYQCVGKTEKQLWKTVWQVLQVVLMQGKV